MYAPKFRSWMTEEDRFMEALSFRLDRMADDAHSEIRKMAEDAIQKEPEKPQTQDALLALYRQQMLAPYSGQYPYGQALASPYELFGGIFNAPAPKP